jgi:arylsulfatase A-like enzyme
MNRRNLLLALFLFSASPLLAAEKPNIVVIVADDMRPDCIAALGHPVIKTPNLDRLVREGTAFPRAVAAYPICHVSRAELLTGCTAFRCGVPWRGNLIDPKLATWAGTFRDAGYQTWYVGKWHNDGRPKERGYTATRGLYTSGGAKGQPLTFPRDSYGRPVTGYTGWTFKNEDGEVELEKGIGLTAETSKHIGDAAVAFIEQKETKPFFLHVNFAAPHDPRIFPPGTEKMYDPAKMPLPPSFRKEHGFDHGNLKGRDEVLLAYPRDPEEVKRELAVYYALISDMDAHIGRILAALETAKKLDNALIIFTSDQGMAVGSHGLVGKQNLYDHTFGVPLVMRGPGIAKGKKLPAQCYLRDLFPTTCDLAGITIPATAEGKSLVPVIEGKKDSVYDAVFGYFTDTQRGIRDDRYKLIRYPKANVTQLFDLRDDPRELRNLANDPRYKDRIAAMLAKLQAEQKKWGDEVKLFEKVKP